MQIVATTSSYALLERGDIHAITFLDHDLNIVHQHPLPEGSNPHDVIETDTAYWISLYQAPEVVRLSKETLEEIEPIDGRAWTDADGRPEASDLHLNGDGTVYLTVQNLDFRGVEPIPPEQSQLVHLSSSGSSSPNIPSRRTPSAQLSRSVNMSSSSPATPIGRFKPTRVYGISLRYATTPSSGSARPSSVAISSILPSLMRPSSSWFHDSILRPRCSATIASIKHSRSLRGTRNHSAVSPSSMTNGLSVIAPADALGCVLLTSQATASKRR